MRLLRQPMTILITSRRSCSSLERAAVTVQSRSKRFYKRRLSNKIYRNSRTWINSFKTRTMWQPKRRRNGHSTSSLSCHCSKRSNPPISNKTTPTLSSTNPSNRPKRTRSTTSRPSYLRTLSDKTRSTNSCRSRSTNAGNSSATKKPSRKYWSSSGRS